MSGYLMLELRRMLRTPGFLVFTIAMPLVVYLVFSNLGSLTGQDRHDTALYAMVTIGGYGAIGAMLNYGSGVVSDRTLGWLRQLRLTPLSPVKVVLAKAVTGMLLAVPPVAAMCLAGGLVNGVSLSVGQWIAVIALMWLGASPFVVLGLGIGYVATAQTVQPVSFLSYFGMSLLGGLLIPLNVLPHGVASVGRLLPTHGYADLAVRVAFHESTSAGDIALLGTWLVLFAGFAVHAYRRAAATR